MKQVPIAYQIYSARKEAKADLKAVLLQLKEQGYDGVEFAGFYDHAAAEVKAMLDASGLTAISSHVALSLIEEDPDAVIAYHKAIGCRYIAIPAINKDSRPGTPGFASVLRIMYEFGRKCKENGIQLLYHNHDFEFVSVSGEYALDFIYDALPAELLKSEIDVCWVKYAGEDPCSYVRKYTGRAPIVHLKDYVGRRDGGEAPYGIIGEEEAKASAGIPFEFRPVGYGSQDVKAVVEAGLDAGAEWFVVEQDESVNRPPLEAAAMSMDTLRKIGLKA